MRHTIEGIQRNVRQAVSQYNTAAPDNARIVRVDLFGSYAEGRENDASDVDLLVRFSSPVVSLFTLARALETMEKHLGVSVDLVCDPLPKESFLEIRKKVGLYEAA